jgi:hypothetical protein
MESDVSLATRKAIIDYFAASSRRILSAGADGLGEGLGPKPPHPAA